MYGRPAHGAVSSDNMKKQLQEVIEQRDKAFRELFRVRKQLAGIVKSLKEENKELTQKMIKLAAEKQKVQKVLVPDRAVEKGLAEALEHVEVLQSKNAGLLSFKKGVHKQWQEIEKGKKEVSSLKEELDEANEECDSLHLQLKTAQEERDKAISAKRAAIAAKRAAIERETKRTAELRRELSKANNMHGELQEKRKQEGSVHDEMKKMEALYSTVLNDLINTRVKLACVEAEAIRPSSGLRNTKQKQKRSASML